MAFKCEAGKNLIDLVIRQRLRLGGGDGNVFAIAQEATVIPGDTGKKRGPLHKQAYAPAYAHFPKIQASFQKIKSLGKIFDKTIERGPNRDRCTEVCGSTESQMGCLGP